MAPSVSDTWKTKCENLCVPPSFSSGRSALGVLGAGSAFRGLILSRCSSHAHHRDLCHLGHLGMEPSADFLQEHRKIISPLLIPSSPTNGKTWKSPSTSWAVPQAGESWAHEIPHIHHNSSHLPQPGVQAAPSPLPLPKRCAAVKYPQIKQFCLDTQTHRDLPLTQQILLKVGTVKTNTVACSTLPRLLLTALVRRRRCWVLCYNEEEDSVGKGVEFDTEVSRAGKRKSRKSALCHLKLLWH